MRLLLIVKDARAVGPVLAALPRGGVGVQLRDKSLPAAALLERARELREICTEHGAPLVVNDRLDVALAARADGVHLPERGVSPRDARALLSRDGRAALVGVSCHDGAQVKAAASAGADYALFSPIWEVPDKGAPVGIEALRRAARENALPLFALGGVTAANAGEAMAAGAHGVACIRFVFEAHDPVAAAVALWRAVTA
jgi:thiamine-phosphate pyrophosphorylase